VDVPEKSANTTDAPALQLQEDVMDEPILFKIDRRRLLALAASTPAGVIVPNVEFPATATAQPLPLTPQISALNVSAATARRLLEISRRNAIRREAGLPALSIPKTLRQMKRQADVEESERFAATHSSAVWQEVLKPRREAERNPNWQPSCGEAMNYQIEVREILRKIYAQQKRSRAAVRQMT
jgi:hypothetical protein